MKKSKAGREAVLETGDRNNIQGISNRETAEEEANERAEHPPIQEGSPPPEDAAGRTGDAVAADSANEQTSRKAGSRSVAQKTANTRNPDGPTPAAGKVAGAFGREPSGGRRRKP
jgi:hypothetical protein